MQKTDVEILKILRDEHIDLENMVLGSLTSFKAIRKRMGLLSTRQQKQTLETIREVMVDLRSNIHWLTGMKVSRTLIVVYFRIWEPELVRQRRAGRLKRRRFWAAGPNDLLAVDQHDKWKRLDLHFTLWIEIWWTNSNPKLILSYYLVWSKILDVDASEEECKARNYLVSAASTFYPGFEDILTLESTTACTTQISSSCLCFSLDFYPFPATELNAWKDLVNNTKKRADRNKVLPHGVQMISIFSCTLGCLDFKIKVEQEAIDHVRRTLAPPDDPVFQLVPETLWKSAKFIFKPWRPNNADDAVPPAGRELYGGIENPGPDGIITWVVLTMVLELTPHTKQTWTGLMQETMSSRLGRLFLRKIIVFEQTEDERHKRQCTATVPARDA
ncbi:hypothetical protein BJ912DRAFT_1093135 [Pholiota molesta]|nr:hypothetical protein BJ912DRAFT_1093135 [Pholiota molesta]